MVPQTVWLFTSASNDVVPDAHIPQAAFRTLAAADRWVRTLKPSGMLTEYPMNIGVFEWATARGVFKPRRDDQRATPFIETFSDASQAHAHYELGELVSGCEQRGIPTEATVVWAFNGRGRRGCFPSAVFDDQSRVEDWIASIGASGTLTKLVIGDQGTSCDLAAALEFSAGRRVPEQRA